MASFRELAWFGETGVGSIAAKAEIESNAQRGQIGGDCLREAIDTSSKRFSMSSRLRGLVPIGYQASPSLAVRRIAGPLSPPTQIGPES